MTTVAPSPASTIEQPRPVPADTQPGYDLRSVTAQPIQPRTPRETPFRFGGIATTEVCNLSCVMCHFNGPNATKKAKQLSPENVRRVLDQISPGSQVHFAATGDFFMDPHAVEHLRYAVSRGLRPLILSHGQLYTPELLDDLLAIGVRGFRISCDAIDSVHYARIRRGGELQKILDAVDHLNSRRGRYPDLTVEINCTLFRKTFPLQAEFEAFWSGKVDAIHFNAEYYDAWRFRNLFAAPERRGDCTIQTYILPTGRIAPCCGVMVHSHEGDVSWLPSVETHTLAEAYRLLCDMYEDPASPLAKLCHSCEWWIVWAGMDSNGTTPYCRPVQLPRIRGMSDTRKAPEREPLDTERKLLQLSQALHEEKLRRRESEAQNERLRRQAELHAGEQESAEVELVRLHDEIAALRSSTSWRITAPLRWVRNVIRAAVASRIVVSHRRP